MTLLVSYIIIVLLNLKFQKSRILYAIDFFFMWLLMGWSYNVADYPTYLLRYTHPEIYGTLEPLYVILQNGGNLLGLDYNTFLACMAFVFLLIRYILVKLMSMRPNYVVGLYLLFPFVMDITQIRMFYATTIVLLGIFVLVKNYKCSDILYAFIVVLATMIHAACIVYLLVLFAKHVKDFNTSNYLKGCILACVVFYILLPTNILYDSLAYISGIFGFETKFIETVFATGQAYKFTHKITYMLEIMLFFCVMNLIFRRAIRSQSAICDTEKIESIRKYKDLEMLYFCTKVNCSLLIILPLAWFSGDIYRIQHGIVMFFYIVISNLDNFRSAKRGKIKINQLFLSGFIVVFMLLFLIGEPSLRENVFLPVFFENGLFR